MATGWTYDAAKHQYVSPSGRKLTQQSTAQLRNNFAKARSEVARSIAEQYTSGAITKAEFSAAFEVFVSDTMTASYLAGRGGVNAIVDSDLDAILKLITDQLGFADAFAAELDGLSAEAIAERASLYGDAAVHAFENGHGASHDVELPGYPGDWLTECKSGCRCSWIITVQSDGTTEYVWETASDGNVCGDCEQRGRDWSPWVPD